MCSTADFPKMYILNLEMNDDLRMLAEKIALNPCVTCVSPFDFFLLQNL